MYRRNVNQHIMGWVVCRASFVYQCAIAGKICHIYIYIEMNYITCRVYHLHTILNYDRKSLCGSSLQKRYLRYNMLC